MLLANSPAATGEKPRLTYSSVIRSLVEQLTQRSPFLQNCDNSTSQIARLDRNEIQIGELLGQGNFSNVYEVIGFKLQHHLPTTQGLSQHIVDGTPRKNDMGIGALDSQSAAGKDQQDLDSGHTVRPCQDKTLDKDTEPTFAAQKRLRQSNYAVKCLKPELLASPTPKAFLEAAADLVIEAKYLSRLNHVNILSIRGLARGWESAFANGEYDSFFILVDRLEETLHRRIKGWKNGEFPKENTIKQKLAIALQIASALAYLHDRNLIYRDLKPYNIGLIHDTQKGAGDSDSSLTVKLFDFGFVRELPVVEQARDDTEATTKTSVVSTLESGENVYLMSGKGTRRYMAPEALRESRYNLKADVYSWAMVCWEIITLLKPFYKYSKEQHYHFVCKGGDRPPLEPISTLHWLPSSFHTASTSLSSIQSSRSIGDESIDFQQIMTDPLRNLLRRAWHQDVSQRYTMKEVHQTLQVIIDSLGVGGEDRNPPPSASLSSDLSNTNRRNGYSCLSSITEYGDMRNLVEGFATDFQELPFLNCFGHHVSSSSHQKEGKEKENANPDQVANNAITMPQPALEKMVQKGHNKQRDDDQKMDLTGEEKENKVLKYTLPVFQALVTW